MCANKMAFSSDAGTLWTDRYRRTDRQTHLLYKYRGVSMLMRDKNGSQIKN